MTILEGALLVAAVNQKEAAFFGFPYVETNTGIFIKSQRDNPGEVKRALVLERRFAQVCLDDQPTGK